MYGDVNVIIEDGNLGKSNATGVGVHVKVGISDIESQEPIIITSNMSNTRIMEKLGNSPLADANMDAMEGGATTIINIPVTATTNGTIGTLVHTGTGIGTVAVVGNPKNTFDIILKITESGATNEAALSYSTDGGNHYSADITIPLSKSYVIPNTGLTVNFTEGADAALSFIEGDRYVVSTTAPTMSNAEVLESVNKLVYYNGAFEFVHIVGVSGKALWASLAAMADLFVSAYKKPCYFLCEGRNKESEESLDQYVVAMQEERKGLNNQYIQVCLASCWFKRKDERVQIVNLAGYLSGFYSRSKESQSIGEVKTFPIAESKLLKLLPEGVSEYIEDLDQLQYMTVRQYYGKENYFVTSANMMSSEASDYRYAEDVRVSNRLVKAVRAKGLDTLQMEIDPNDIEVSIAFIKENLNIAIEDAIADKIISSGTLDIDVENANILVDENLDVSVTYVPMGHMREMNITFAVSNPYGSN